MNSALEISDLTASIDDLAILRGIDLSVPFGEVHAVMGPNGSGKSTLCHALMGKDDYTVTGSAKVDGVQILDMTIDERFRAGLFEAFQYPIEVPGVTLDELTAAMAESDPSDHGYAERQQATSDLLDMDRFRDRFVNVGLSGGEKKRSEMYLLGVANPKVAILDEIDSGLDIDAVKQVAEMVETLRSPNLGVLVITHYSRILRFMDVDRVHVMVKGKIVKSGGPAIAEELEGGGYTELQAANA
jgi:Fe-S cluster assembly ATP-binding protein